MMRASQLASNNESSSQQFDTIRKMRTMYSNIYESSFRVSDHIYICGGLRGEIIIFSNYPTRSRLFSGFSKDLLEKTGKQIKHDLSSYHRILQIILVHLNREFEDKSCSSYKRMWVVVLETYLVACFL